MHLALSTMSNLTKSCYRGSTTISILQMGKLRCRKGNYVAQSHTMSQWQT